MTIRSCRTFAAVVLLAGLAAEPALGQRPDFAPGRVVVLAEPGAITLPPGLTRASAGQVQVTVSQMRTILAQRGLTSVRRAVPRWEEALTAIPQVSRHFLRKGEHVAPDEIVDLASLYVLEFPTDRDARSIADELKSSAGVVYAEPDYFITSVGVPASPPSSRRSAFALYPNDPRFTGGFNWGFYSPSNPSWDTNAPDAWQIQTGQESVRIAFLDSGMQTDHPDFGYGAKVVAQYDFVNDDGNAYPDLNIDAPFHGTAVAGIAAAQTNDAFGTAGLCGGFGTSRGCGILAAKILGDLSVWQLFTEWLGTTDLTADAATWAIANGAKVLNNSWCASELNYTTHNAFRNAYLSGAVVTAAMGNTQGKCGQNSETDAVVPAQFSDIVIAVGATDQFGDRITNPPYSSLVSMPSPIVALRAGEELGSHPSSPARHGSLGSGAARARGLSVR